MKKILLLIVGVFINLNVWAYSFAVDGMYYNITSSIEPYTVEVTYLTVASRSYSGIVIIPSIVKDSNITYNVTNIGSLAFRNCNNLTSITIPETITNISSEAFAYCTGLTTINIPNSVTSIGYGAFTRCDSLTNITISQSISNIPDYAFFGCSSLTSFDIPTSVKTIGANAFYGCTGLKSITIPTSITRIPENTFYNCQNLTSIDIPSSITYIGDYAFYNCKGLSNIIIPNSVTTIGNYSFEYCTGLKSITIPPSVSIIGSNAFQFCTNLISIEIPPSVTSIGSNAFDYCSGYISVDSNNINFSSYNGVLYNKDQTTLIKCPISINGSYNIPSTVTSIVGGAFTNCTNLTDIIFPASVTSIGLTGSAFDYCTGYFSVDSNNLKFSSYNGVLYNKNQTNLIKCPISINGSYSIPSTVTSIGSSAFSGCSSLTAIIIPAFVTKISDYAFMNCSGLMSITCYDSIPPTISSYTFKGINNEIPVYVPSKSVDLYKSATYWKNFTNIQALSTDLKSPYGLDYNINISNNCINIENILNANISIHDLFGREIYNKKYCHDKESINILHKGIYIITINNYAVKILVK